MDEMGKTSISGSILSRRLVLFAMLVVSLGLLVLSCIEIVQGVPDSYYNDKWRSVAQNLTLLCLVSAMIFQDSYRQSSARESFSRAMCKLLLAIAFVSIGFNFYLVF